MAAAASAALARAGGGASRASPGRRDVHHLHPRDRRRPGTSRLARSGSQWIITSTGRLGDFTLNRFELKYAADWQPIELRVEGTQAGKPGDKGAPKKLQLVDVVRASPRAINEITQNGVTNSKTDQISARTVVLPNNVFAGYEALAARLANANVGTELPTYVPPQGEVKVDRQGHSRRSDDDARRHRQDAQVQLLVHGARHGLDVHDDRVASTAGLGSPGSICRRNGLSVVRSDLAGVAARTLTARNPTDSDVTIPANGFNIAGTMTMPPVIGRLRHPAVVLVGELGPGRSRRHGRRHPDLSQLAGALAEQGFLVLRYDKRARRPERRPKRNRHAARLRRRPHRHRQVARQARRCRPAPDCGGRPQRRRHDRHARGGAREKDRHRSCCWRRAGSSGADLILEQQRRQLDLMKLPRSRKSASRVGAAEADSSRRRQRQRLGIAARGRAQAGGHAVVPQPAAVRSGGGDAETQAADPRSSRATSIRRCRRSTPKNSASWRARARRRRTGRSRAPARRQPPPRPGDDRRGPGISRSSNRKRSARKLPRPSPRG